MSFLWAWFFFKKKVSPIKTRFIVLVPRYTIYTLGVAKNPGSQWVNHLYYIFLWRGLELYFIIHKLLRVWAGPNIYLKSPDFSHGFAAITWHLFLPAKPEVFLVFDVCRWLVELIDGSPLLIAPWREIWWFGFSRFVQFGLEMNSCGT